MRNRLPACVAFAIAVLSSAGFAGADPPAPVRFTHGSGAEKCISEDALAKAVTLRLGSSAPVVRTVEGRVERSAGKATFRATLALIGPNGATVGTREVWTRSMDCRALDGDLALVAALLLDPEGPFPAAPPPAEKAAISGPARDETATLSPADAPANTLSPADADSPSRPASDPSNNPSRADSDSVVERASESRPPPLPWSVFARGGPVVSMGLFPTIGAGAAAHVEIAPPGVPPIEIGAVYWAEQRVTSDLGAIGADMWIAYAALAACPYRGEEAGFWGAACAGIEIGAVHVGGIAAGASGSAGPAVERVVPIAGAVLGARVRRSIAGRLYAGAAFDLSIPVVRPELYYQSEGARREAFVASPLIGALELSVGVRLQ